MFPKTLKILHWNCLCFELKHHQRSLHCFRELFIFLPNNLFIFSIFSCFTKSGDQPQEDITKFVYKTNKKVENLGILFHVGKPLEPIN
jgi:hypothetical protein